MRNRRKEDDGGYAMMMSIVALLFALAEDAERAARLPDAERYRLLWILRPAEAVARKLALEAAWYPDLCELPPVALLDDESPTEALRLASFFRVVAFLLGSLLTRLKEYRQATRLFGLTEAIIMRVGGQIEAPAISRTGPRPWPDTS